MKSIIKVVLISLIIVTILGYAENRTNEFDNITINESFYSVAKRVNGSFITTKINDSYFSVSKLNWTRPTFNIRGQSPDNTVMVQIISTTDNATYENMYEHFRVEINQSFITNITYEDNKMIIFVDKGS